MWQLTKMIFSSVLIRDFFCNGAVYLLFLLGDSISWNLEPVLGSSPFFEAFGLSPSFFPLQSPQQGKCYCLSCAIISGFVHILKWTGTTPGWAFLIFSGLLSLPLKVLIMRANLHSTIFWSLCYFQGSILEVKKKVKNILAFWKLRVGNEEGTVKIFMSNLDT